MKKKTSVKKVAGIIVVTVLLILVTVALVGSYYIGGMVADGILNTNNGNDTKKNSVLHLEKWGYDLEGFQKSWPETKFTITAKDGTIVPAAYYSSGEAAPRGVAVLVHGHGGDHVFTAPMAEQYLRQGWDVYAYDQRSSGDSENPYFSFGYYEKQDIEALVEYITANKPELPIVLQGQSMGATTALLYGATAHGQQHLAALVVDSPMLGMEDGLLQVMRQEGMPAEYMAFCGNWYISWNFGFSFKDADALVAAKKITTPVLMIFSKQDELISVDDGQRIFDALASENKELWLADSAHIEAIKDTPERYEETVFGFLAQAVE